MFLNSTRHFAASIIIPTYNRGGILNQTLYSLSSQIHDMADVEIIIVDDGSSDNTSEIAESYCHQLNIKYLFQEDNGYRVATARNLGIKNSSGEIILFIDSGMLLHSGYVSEHLKLHKANENNVVIGYMFGLGNTSGLEQNIVLDHLDNTMASFVQNKIYLDIRESSFKLCNDSLNDLPAPWVLFWTGNASLRKNMLLQSGLFDENFDKLWGMEDIDLGYRLHVGTEVKFVLSRMAMSIHFPHESDFEEKMIQESVNKEYFHHKYNSYQSELLLHTTTDKLNIVLSQVSLPDEAKGRKGYNGSSINSDN